MADEAPDPADASLYTLPDGQEPGETFTTLVSEGGARVERIVSPPGYRGPEDAWFDQPWPEWVAVLTGAAELLFADETAPRQLAAGDHVLIAPGRRHRVVATDALQPTIWLAVHLPPG